MVSWLPHLNATGRLSQNNAPQVTLTAKLGSQQKPGSESKELMMMIMEFEVRGNSVCQCYWSISQRFNLKLVCGHSAHVSY
jgi:hypothetical protein